MLARPPESDYYAIRYSCSDPCMSNGFLETEGLGAFQNIEPFGVHKRFEGGRGSLETDGRAGGARGLFPRTVLPALRLALGFALGFGLGFGPRTANRLALLDRWLGTDVKGRRDMVAAAIARRYPATFCRDLYWGPRSAIYDVFFARAFGGRAAGGDWGCGRFWGSAERGEPLDWSCLWDRWPDAVPLVGRHMVRSSV